MKLAVLSATSTAVILCSSIAYSDSLPPDEYHEQTNLQKENHSHWTGKNTLSLKLRNYYQDRKIKDFKNKTYSEKSTQKNTVKNHKKQKAWGQGLEVNFESAFLGKESAGIGLDFSLFGGLKLLGKNDRFGTNILREDIPTYNAAQKKYFADQDSYIKVGTTNIKGFIGDDESSIKGRAGWMEINKPLLQTYQRLTPTTFQAASADIKAGNLELYGVIANKVSLYNHDRMEDLTSNKPGSKGRHKKHTKINYLQSFGGSYNHASGLGGDIAFAESESYLKLYHVRLNYILPIDDGISLLLDGQYYKGEGNGDKWKNKGTTYGGFDNSASLYNLNAQLNYDMFAFNASFSKTDAQKDQGLGFFDYHLASEPGNDYDDLGYWTKRQISDFNYNGEKVWQAGVQYRFDDLGLPGLMLGYTYTSGSDIETTLSRKKKTSYSESEHNLTLGYSFQQDELKGLNVTLLYAQHNGDNEISKLKNPDKEGYEYERKTDLRVFVDYTVSVF